MDAPPARRVLFDFCDGSRRLIVEDLGDGELGFVTTGPDGTRERTGVILPLIERAKLAVVIDNIYGEELIAEVQGRLLDRRNLIPAGYLSDFDERFLDDADWLPVQKPGARPVYALRGEQPEPGEAEG